MGKKKNDKKIKVVEPSAIKEENPVVKAKDREEIQYLRNWTAAPQVWKFKKAKQNALFQHIYNKHRIGKSDFGIFLQYIEKLQGAARERLIQQAKEILQKAEKQAEPSDAVESGVETAVTEAEKPELDVITDLQRKRAKKILKTLTIT